MKTTERERAAFLLGIEYAADQLERLCEEDADQLERLCEEDVYRRSNKARLLDLAKSLWPRMAVTQHTSIEVELDLTNARKGIDA